jgi:nucleoside-diphosphate-sugar epimerase
MKTILITGINGFLGSSLAKSLAKTYEVIGLEYSLNNLFRIKDENFKVYPVENGITNDIFTENEIDIIIHTATFYGKNEDITKMSHANLFSPFELLDKAIKNGCKLFINTDTVLDRFTNIYSLTKHQFCEWLQIRQNEIKIINMQLEHFYGPGASPTNFITFMISRLKQNEPEIELTAGEQLRDFIYIDDIVGAYRHILENQTRITDSYTNFQVCSGELWTIKNLMLELKTLIKSTSKLKFGAIPYRENELMKSESNNTELINLGWTPKYSLKEGLLKTIEETKN